MFRIAEDQFERIDAALRSDFHERMLDHIARCFPDHDAALDVEQKHALIDHGIDRAAFWEVTAERDVCLFIDLCLILGPDFDADEALPWARAILADRAIRTPGERMEALHARTLTVFEARAAEEEA